MSTKLVYDVLIDVGSVSPKQVFSLLDSYHHGKGLAQHVYCRKLILFWAAEARITHPSVPLSPETLEMLQRVETITMVSAETDISDFLTGYFAVPSPKNQLVHWVTQQEPCREIWSKLSQMIQEEKRYELLVFTNRQPEFQHVQSRRDVYNKIRLLPPVVPAKALTPATSEDESE